MGPISVGSVAGGGGGGDDCMELSAAAVGTWNLTDLEEPTSALEDGEFVTGAS